MLLIKEDMEREVPVICADALSLEGLDLLGKILEFLQYLREVSHANFDAPPHSRLS